MAPVLCHEGTFEMRCAANTKHDAGAHLTLDTFRKLYFCITYSVRCNVVHAAEGYTLQCLAVFFFND